MEGRRAATEGPVKDIALRRGEENGMWLPAAVPLSSVRGDRRGETSGKLSWSTTASLCEEGDSDNDNEGTGGTEGIQTVGVDMASSTTLWYSASEMKP